jgi:hypothetical protein
MNHSDFDQRVKTIQRNAFFYFLITTLIAVFVTSFLVPYTINTWLEFVGKEPVALWWHGAILGCIPSLPLRSLILVAAAGTWVAMLFLA